MHLVRGDALCRGLGHDLGHQHLRQALGLFAGDLAWEKIRAAFTDKIVARGRRDGHKPVCYKRQGGGVLM